MTTIRKRAFAREMKDKEDGLIDKRRTAAGGVTGEHVGLALSGGGIRSATFALGLLQSLAKARLLSRVDYLSTVSGGGYVGSFLGALFSRPAAAGVAADQPRVTAVEEALTDRSGWLVRWLRENGRYLSPNGAGDTLLAAAAMLRNWAAVHIVLGTFALATFVGLVVVESALGALLGEQIAFCATGVVAARIWWSPAIAFPLLTLLFWALPSGGAYWLVPAPLSHEKVWHRYVLPTTAALVLALQVVLLWLWSATTTPWQQLQVAALLTTLLIPVYCLAAFVKTGADVPRTQHELTVWLKSGIIVSAALAALALIDSLGQSFYVLTSHGALWRWLAPIPVAIGGAAAFGQKLLELRGSKSRDSRLGVPLATLAMVAALLLCTIELVAYSAISHAIVWQGKVPPGELTSGLLPQADTAAVGLSPDHHVTVNCPSCTPESQPNVSAAPLPPDRLLPVFVVLVALCWAFGRTRSFMNQSSMAPIYGARLRRAYLGASNPRRYEDRHQRTVTRDVDGDELLFESYQPWATGGPLHLLNVTLNETVSGESQVEQRDRKGLPMAFGPVGVSVGVRHHAVWAGERMNSLQPAREEDPSLPESTGRSGSAGFRVFDQGNLAILPEKLTLSRLVAVSGAAVSTGLGSRTSLGTSLLLGLLNVRLGHWWQSGVDPTLRSGDAATPRRRFWTTLGALFARAFAVQSHLLNEFLARFHGPARINWNLSDGGHFENSGCYELLRRRVPVIIVADDGADPDYVFDDLAQLVRKARLDFGATLRCATAEELANLDDSVRPYFGPPEAIRGNAAPEGNSRRWNQAHAALLFADYPDTDEASTIIWIKPSVLKPDESRRSGVAVTPEDVLRYATEHPSFPQESTGDQYFDEAQWESYRCLGEHIGDLIFGGDERTGGTSGGWDPRGLRPFTPGSSRQPIVFSGRIEGAAPIAEVFPTTA